MVENDKYIKKYILLSLNISVFMMKFQATLESSQ